MRHPSDDAPYVRLRKAEPCDGPRVLWLEEAAMKDHATALWGSWRPAQTLANLDLRNHEMIEVDGTCEGCLAMRQGSDAVHLNRLYLAPEARNRGLGGLVLGSVIERANRLKIPIKLSVLTTNPAVRFYQRHGFEVEAVTAERRHMIRHQMPQREDDPDENY